METEFRLPSTSRAERILWIADERNVNSPRAVAGQQNIYIYITGRASDMLTFQSYQSKPILSIQTLDTLHRISLT